MKDYCAVANILCHENQPGLNNKVGRKTSKAFLHFDIDTIQLQTSSYAYNNSMKGMYGLPSFITMDQNGNKSLKGNSAKNRFNKSYTKYSEPISTYNKIYKQDRKANGKDELMAKYHPPAINN